jgi:hypothetical protein
MGKLSKGNAAPHVTDDVEDIGEGGDADSVESVAALRRQRKEELRQPVMDVGRFVPDHERDVTVESREDEQLVKDRIADMAIRDELQQREVAREGGGLVDE